MKGTKFSNIVWFDDLDWNMHMNNSVYNKNCEWARYEFIYRSGEFSKKFHVFMISKGIWELARKNGWLIANGGVSYQFKKSLTPFQRYQIHVRLHR